MKVLIVDDDAIQRMLMAEMLQHFERVEIIEAADADSAWRELQSGLCPVLCCCDMRMPGMPGMELLQHFKSRPALAGVPFIFITAATDRDTVREAIASGATNYILKPFNLAKARSSLEKVFRGINDQYSEEPAATQRRLGANTPEKLLGYFDAFKQQLVDARLPIHEQLVSGETGPARARLDGVKSGCSTLGLWHAAKMIEHIHAMEAELVERILGDVDAVVDEQVARIKTAFSIRDVATPKEEAAAAEEVEPVADPA